MAELTTLDSKLGEVIGLAMASKVATERIDKVVEDQQVGATLRKLHDDAVKIEAMGTELVNSDDYKGKKTAILEQARTTKQEATEMMDTYLGDDFDALDGFEFLTMAEAGEVGHWRVVETLNEQYGSRELKELTDYVVPLQDQHLQMTLTGATALAADEDPTSPA